MTEKKLSPKESHCLARRFGGVVFNGAPPRAKHIQAEPIHDRQQTGIAFAIDESFKSSVLIDWTDFGASPPEKQLATLNRSLLALVAQFCLPETIHMSSDSSCSADGVARNILQMLYDIRCFCDETGYRNSPTLAEQAVGTVHADRSTLSDRRALVMLSGGFDSTFAAVLLKRAGFDVVGLHVRANRHVEAQEHCAAEAISAQLDIPLHNIRMVFPDQERIGRYYSRTFGEYPFYNSVPHGRDFPLAVLGAIVATQLGCRHVVFGHEKESRHKILNDGIRRVYRHDIESAYGAQLTAEYLRETVHPDVQFWSPLASVSIYMVRRIMLLRFPDLVRDLCSCFWGHRCEKCLKCLSTYTMQRHLQVEVQSFNGNPFADQDDEDMRMFADPDRPSESIGYGPQMHFAMTSIVDAGFLSPEDYWLHHYAKYGLKAVRSQIQRIKHVCIELGVPDSSAPEHINAILEQLR